MQGLERIEAEVQQIIKDDFPDVFIVEIKLQRSGQSVLSIALDTDAGIGIGTCASISRKLNQFFEEEEPFDFPFRLEVSSPGVGKPLVVHRQYLKNVGRKIRVTLNDGSQVFGRLAQADDAGLTVRKDPPKKKKKGEALDLEVPLTYADIKEARIEISFD